MPVNIVKKRTHKYRQCPVGEVLQLRFCSTKLFHVAERHQEQLGWFRPGQFLGRRLFPGPRLLSLVLERHHVPEHLPNRLAVPCSAAVGAHSGCAGLSRPKQLSVEGCKVTKA